MVRFNANQVLLSKVAHCQHCFTMRLGLSLLRLKQTHYGLILVVGLSCYHIVTLSLLPDRLQQRSRVSISLLTVHPLTDRRTEGRTV